MKEGAGSQRIVAPNFEEMCIKLTDEVQKLHLENERLHCELDATRRRCAILEGQIGIVQLIFGGR
ncbi:MAG: hypothetical protein E7448_03895 [Ruminococcaceae bacterium]|nr:hypothetical protein [Oscillospiraceae bacterium]